MQIGESSIGDFSEAFGAINLVKDLHVLKVPIILVV